jgi:hypothetical protein
LIAISRRLAILSNKEDRWIDIGLSGRSRILYVVYAERLDVIQIISSRPATPEERKIYSGKGASKSSGTVNSPAHKPKGRRLFTARRDRFEFSDWLVSCLHCTENSPKQTKQESSGGQELYATHWALHSNIFHGNCSRYIRPQ